MGSVSEQAPGQNPRFVAKFTVAEHYFQLTPVVIEIKTGITPGSIIQCIREIRESIALNRKLFVDRRWLHGAFIRPFRSAYLPETNF
jgi:hypothetical protein